MSRWTEGIPAAIPMRPRTCECDDDECGGTCAGSRSLTVSEALKFELTHGMTVTEMLGGKQLCATCRGEPPRGFACLRCGTRGAP